MRELETSGITSPLSPKKSKALQDKDKEAFLGYFESQGKNSEPDVVTMEEDKEKEGSKNLISEDDGPIDGILPGGSGQLELS